MRRIERSVFMEFPRLVLEDFDCDWRSMKMRKWTCLE